MSMSARGNGYITWARPVPAPQTSSSAASTPSRGLQPVKPAAVAVHAARDDIRSAHLACSSASVPSLGSPTWRGHLTASATTAGGPVVAMTTPRATMPAAPGVHRMRSQPVSSASGLCATTAAALAAHIRRDDGGEDQEAVGAIELAQQHHLLGGPLVVAGANSSGRCKSSRPSFRQSCEAVDTIESLTAETQDLLATARRSADVQVAEGGRDLQLRVRILPSELFRWSDLQICAHIDKASFGEVLLARRGRHVLSAKRCRIGADGTMTKEQLHNFEREINAYRVLRHPGIVRYVGCVLEHPNLVILTEYLSKGNVFNLLFMNRVNLPADIRLRISQQVTEVVGFMHSLNPVVAHLDLKTPNILLDDEYNAKLCDFGKTQVIEEGGSVLQGHELLGSPRYMAPELFLGTGARFTEKADIWGLACCLVEILGGPIPYEDVPEVSQIVDCLKRELPPLVPQWFVDSVGRALKQCFRFDPESRLAAPELLVALDGLSAHEMERHGMDKRRAN